MTVLWLIVWACDGFPQVYGWNSWLVALLVMAGIDIGEWVDTQARRMQRRDR